MYVFANSLLYICSFLREIRPGQLGQVKRETVRKKQPGSHTSNIQQNCCHASAWFSQNSGVTLNIVKPVCGKVKPWTRSSFNRDNELYTSQTSILSISVQSWPSTSPHTIRPPPTSFNQGNFQRELQRAFPSPNTGPKSIQQEDSNHSLGLTLDLTIKGCVCVSVCQVISSFLN